jgi:hypothetical protein
MFQKMSLILSLVALSSPAAAFNEIPLRPDQDGAGPSHIFHLQDDYVAVVDPLDAKLQAFKLCGSQTACDQTLARTTINRLLPSGSRFGRIVRQPTQIVLISEDLTKKLVVPRNVSNWPNNFALADHDRTDKSLTIPILSRNTPDRLTIQARGNLPSLPIRAIGPGYLASARELDSDRDGRRYVLWKEYRFNDSRPFNPEERTIHVDVFVGRFERDGTLSGVATLPRDQMTRIGFDYATVTPDGSLLLLASFMRSPFRISQLGFVAPNKIIIQKYVQLTSKKVKSAIPPQVVQIRDLVPPENSPPEPQIPSSSNAAQPVPAAQPPRPSKAQFSQAMTEYQTHPWNVTNKNLRDPCEEEIIDGQEPDCPIKRFVRPPQFVRKPYPDLIGLAYDWGGADTLRAYDDKLARGYVAGNIGDTFWTKGKPRVTAGIDCSGLVSNVWKLDGSYQTDSLAKVSVPLTQLDQLRVGDIFLLEGHHVVLFREQLTPDGASMAIRVTEAASRCGSVCDSTYEIDFFDGYKIRRRK